MKIIKEANYGIWENNSVSETQGYRIVSNEKCCNCDTQCGCDDYCARDGTNEDSGVTCTGSVSH